MDNKGFEIRHNGFPRTFRDRKDKAFEAGRFQEPPPSRHYRNCRLLDRTSYTHPQPLRSRAEAGHESALSEQGFNFSFEGKFQLGLASEISGLGSRLVTCCTIRGRRPSALCPARSLEDTQRSLRLRLGLAQYGQWPVWIGSRSAQR